MSEDKKSSATAEVGEDLKNVTVFMTVGKKSVQFQSGARTWKELQSALNEVGMKHAGMKAVIGETRNTLESDQALLPDTDFTLFLMPIKVKSGNERSDLFELIKAAVAKNPALKQRFIVDGKNMTQLSTDTLKTLWAKHGTGGTVAAPAAAEKAGKVEKTLRPVATPTTTKGNVGDVVAAVGEAKATLEEAVLKAKAAYKKAVAADMDEETQDLLLEKLAKAQEALKGFSVPAPTPVKKEEPKETPEQIAAREKQEADRKLNAQLEKQAHNLAKDFSGLDSF